MNTEEGCTAAFHARPRIEAKEAEDERRGLERRKAFEAQRAKEAELMRVREEERVEANATVGLRCYSKPARRNCPDELEDLVVFVVDELGVPLDEEYEGVPVCGKTVLYGCDNDAGNEVVPFIHDQNFGTYPFKFGKAGFALASEALFPAKGRGGFYYIDKTYSKRLEAISPEAVPDIWALASSEPLEFVSIGRYREHGRVGYLSLDDGIITPAKFGSALSFLGRDGMLSQTMVCEDCHPERWMYCPPIEAHCSGDAYLIDRSGKRLRITPPKEYGEYWWCKEHSGRRDLPDDLIYCP